MTENNEITDLNSECGSSEPYALQVTDNSMEPEFPNGLYCYSRSHLGHVLTVNIFLLNMMG